MAFLVGFLIVVLVLVSILLVLIVLVQDDGAEGAGMLLGSSASQQYGARKGNIVTRTTGILATLFISISLVLVFLFRENDSNLQAIESEIGDETENKVVEWWVSNEEDNNETIEETTDEETTDTIIEDTASITEQVDTDTEVANEKMETDIIPLEDANDSTSVENESN